MFAILDFSSKMDSRQTQRPRSAAANVPVTIRRVAALGEYEECVAIQREIWGDQFTETVPSTILRIAQEVGGVTAAAFDAQGAMLGFVFGISGIRDGELAHWSDMLAVRVGARDMGIGKRLKAYQRELLLETGVLTMYWTYDPLVARNAYLNLEQLGARVVEYRPNYYGEDTGSVMHAGLGTDRFIVSWRLDRGTTPRAPDTEWMNAPTIDAAHPDIPADRGRVRIAIPHDIFAVLDAEPALAFKWRDTTREAFTTYLARGYSIAGFMRGNGSEPGTYLLAR